MGIFDLFKKKTTTSTFPENELEKSLMKASSDVSARDEFYTKLLWNELIVLTSGSLASKKGAEILDPGTDVEFVTFANGEIPVFTSTNRIFDKGVIKEEVPIMALKGQDLFGFTKGASFILNPYSEYGKQLVPQEIESLLNGSIFEHSNAVTIPQDTQVLLGQPSKYPTELAQALSNLFLKEQAVKFAYLATIKTDNSNQPPHLIIALDVEGDMSPITAKAGPLAEQVMGKNKIIDFMKIDKSNGISDYFINNTQAFYKRR